eukprot:2812688-Lingulodinium_polyedra.AAC.1
MNVGSTRQLRARSGGQVSYHPAARGGDRALEYVWPVCERAQPRRVQTRWVGSGVVALIRKWPVSEFHGSYCYGCVE